MLHPSLQRRARPVHMSGLCPFRLCLPARPCPSWLRDWFIFTWSVWGFEALDWGERVFIIPLTLAVLVLVAFGAYKQGLRLALALHTHIERLWQLRALALDGGGGTAGSSSLSV
jgi:hypothetical protein